LSLVTGYTPPPPIQEEEEQGEDREDGEREAEEEEDGGGKEEEEEGEAWVRVSQPTLSASASPEARVRFRDNPGMEQSDDDMRRVRSFPPPPPPPRSRVVSWGANPSATATAMTDEDVGGMDFAAASTATATAAVMTDDDMRRMRSTPPSPSPPQSRVVRWDADLSPTAAAAAAAATTAAAVMADDRYAALRPAAANSHFTVGRVRNNGGNEEDTEDADPIPEWMARGRA
jgi:hypothetical protein